MSEDEALKAAAQRAAAEAPPLSQAQVNVVVAAFATVLRRRDSESEQPAHE